jgi:ATP-dependent Clp protease ATP-binding subunit ClpA
MPSLIAQSFDEAKRRNHGWVGTEHLLLALLTRPSVTTDILRQHGITYDSVSNCPFCGTVEPPSQQYDETRGLSGPNPDGQLVIGRAQAFAIAQSFEQPQPEHWLLGMLYSEDGMTFGALLRYFSLTPDILIEELRRRGKTTFATTL